jgi:oligoendopeptidase F
MSRYLGPAVKMKESDGFFFEPWSHIRNFFYVYSYAYGQLISKALYAECKKDASFYKKVDQFLEAGKTMSPDQIFQSIGINTLDPKFFESGIRSIEQDITTLEKLMKKNKLM